MAQCARINITTVQLIIDNNRVQGYNPNTLRALLINNFQVINLILLT